MRGEECFVTLQGWTAPTRTLGAVIGGDVVLILFQGLLVDDSLDDLPTVGLVQGSRGEVFIDMSSCPWSPSGPVSAALVGS